MHTESFGRFRIVREVGDGSTGGAFVAHDPKTDRDVVIVTIPGWSALPAADREAASERFLGAARAARGVAHPAVAGILEVGESEGMPYAVTERCAGETLQAYCSPGTLLDAGAVVDLCASVAEGLGRVHDAGLVHGAIGPSRIVLAGPRRAKLADWGLARIAAAGSPTGPLSEAPDYLAPEQVRGGPIDGRADLFALAAVMFEMLTGERPFAGDSVPSVLYRVVHEEPRDLAPYANRVPPLLAAFLLRALAKEPGRRFPDGATFAAELRRAAPAAGFAPDVSGTANMPSAAVPGPPSPPRRRSLVPYVAGAVVVAAGVAGWFLMLPREEEMPRASRGTFSVDIVTEPEGIEVSLDGRLLAESRLDVPAAGPYGKLVASHGCRRVTHDLSPADAGRTVTLVLDPERAPVTVDAGVPGAALRVNGTAAGASPRQVELDLCRENVVESSAEGYTTASIVLPAGATPMEATRALAALRLDALPRGILRLPSSPAPVTFYVDGKRVSRTSGEIELPEGEHELRAVNEGAWIDVRVKFAIEAGRTVDADPSIPPLAGLVVQAFPSNAKVFLRRGNGPWVYIDDVPLETKVAAGAYRVRAELIPTGEKKERDVVLRPGQAVPLRFTFGINR